MAQGFTAIAAFAGTATAICVSEEAWAEERLLWITAGGFLYLAGTTILPEVLVEEGRGERSSTKTSRGLFRLAQLAAFCTGILFLSMVDSLSGDDHHHNHQSPHDHHGHNHWHHDHSIDKHRQHAEL